MRYKDTFTKEELEQYYLTHTYAETLAHFNITGGVLDRRIKAYNIQKISEVEARASKITEEELRDYYLVQDHSKFETQEYFQLTNWTLSKLFKKYKIIKPQRTVKKRTALTKEARYGSKTYNNRDKYSATCQERYGGVGFQSDELKEKSRATTLERYGAANIRQSEFFKQKASEVKEERYGDPHYNNLERYKQTCLERYGVENASQAEEVKNKISQTVQERYGVKWACMRPEIAYRNDSGPNRAFARLLESNGIEYDREFPLDNRRYDFKIGAKLIEINPYATHNSTWGIKGQPGKDPRYHYEKSKLANENGYQCIHVFDWDDRDKIIQLLQPRKNLYARKLELKEIPQLEANRFLKQYHLQGGSKMQNPCYGLYLNGELIEVMTFGKPRFNKNYEWELIRLCTKTGYCVVGGAERLFKAFIRDHNPNSIISYCDNAKFTGNVYTRLGFEHKSAGAVSRHWYNPETGVHITDNGLRFKGFDKLLGSTYGTFGKGTSNDDLMREHGFYEVYDAGQSVYVWTRE